MFQRRKARPQKRIDSLIGAGTVVQGNVTFTGGLRIDGTINGKVATADDAQGTLVISELAKVSGEVNVSHVVINGAVNGPVTATDYLELQAKARVNGDVVVSRRWKCMWAPSFRDKLMHAETETASVVELKRAGGD